MKPKEHARYRKQDPYAQNASSTGKIADGMPDLGELERFNRMKYGVKKPAASKVSLIGFESCVITASQTKIPTHFN